jgi:hypothetical protein
MKITIPKKVLPDSGLQLFSLLMICMAVILLPFSFDKVDFTVFLTCCLTAIVMYVVNANCKTAEDVKFLLSFVLIGHLIVCAATQYELVTGNHFIVIINDYYDKMGQGNAFGFQGNINDNATVLITGMFSSLYFLKRKPILAGAIVLWTVYLIYCIGSRLSIITLLCIAIIAVGVILLGKAAERGNKATRLILYLMALMAVAVAALTIDTSSFLNAVSNSENYFADANRILFMREALKKTVGYSFFLGNGAGVTQHLIGGFSIHCVLIEIMCDYGIVTLIPLLILISKLLTSFVAQISTKRKIFITGFAATFTIMSFCSSSMLHILEPWIIMAIVWRFYLISCKEASAEAEEMGKNGRKAVPEAYNRNTRERGLKDLYKKTGRNIKQREQEG